MTKEEAKFVVCCEELFATCEHHKVAPNPRALEKALKRAMAMIYDYEVALVLVSRETKGSEW